MKFTEERPDTNLIQAYDEAGFSIKHHRYDAHLIITADTVLTAGLPDTPQDLSSEALTAVLEYAPQILIIGTGETQVFLEPKQLSHFYEKRIGIEIMTTPAACRTFNILVAEGRRVAALLFLLK